MKTNIIAEFSVNTYNNIKTRITQRIFRGNCKNKKKIGWGNELDEGKFRPHFISRFQTKLRLALLPWLIEAQLFKHYFTNANFNKLYTENGQRQT